MALRDTFYEIGQLLNIGSFRNRSNNNLYSQPPNLYYKRLNLNRQEEWVSIDGQEQMLYDTTAELKIVVNRLALMFSNGVFKVRDTITGEFIEDHPALDLLENPNVLQSRNELLFQWYVQKCLYPSTFMYQLKAFDAQEIPNALWNLPPSLMKINRSGKIWKQTNLDEIISSYEMRVDNKSKEVFKTSEIIQFAMPNSDDPILGSSPLHAIRMDLSNIRASKTYQNVILTKKGALGVWSSDAKDGMGTTALMPDEQKEVENSVSSLYGIGDNQSAIAVSRNALKFTSATFPTKDLMFFEHIDAGKSAIIDLYGANKSMFSMDKAATFNNVEAGERHCYQDTIFPQAYDFTSNLSKRWGMLDQGKELVLSYDHVPVMQENEKEATEVMERKVKAYKILRDAEITDDEAREIVGIE